MAKKYKDSPVLSANTSGRPKDPASKKVSSAFDTKEAKSSTKDVQKTQSYVAKRQLYGTHTKQAKSSSVDKGLRGHEMKTLNDAVYPKSFTGV